MSVLSLGSAEALIYREARLLDEQVFDQWLELFTEDTVYWMPAWRDDNSLTQNPDRELSLIYYRGKANLVDRVMRLTSGLSPVSRILPRVVHQVSNIAFDRPPTPDRAVLHSAFCVHAYDPRTDQVRSHFGHYRHELRRDESNWKIAMKFVRLANDMIPTVLDINAI